MPVFEIVKNEIEGVLTLMRANPRNNDESNFYKANISKTNRDPVPDVPLNGERPAENEENLSQDLDSNIDPRPTYKADIKRRIFNSPIENSARTNKYTPVKNGGAEDVPEDKTKQLDLFGGSSIPHFIPKTDEETAAPPVADKNQLVMEGFNTVDAPDENSLTENELEENLKAARSKIAKDFTIPQENIPYTREIPANRNNSTQLQQISKSNRRAAQKYIKKLQKKMIIKTAFISVIGILMLILSFIFTGSPDGTDGSRTGNLQSFIIITFFLFIAAILVGKDEISGGIKALFSRKPNIDTGICVIWLFALLQNVLVLQSPSLVAQSIRLYPAAAVLLAVPVFAAKCLTLQNTLETLSPLIWEDTLYASAKISDKDSAYEMGKDIADGSPAIQYNAKTKSFKDFLAISLYQDASNTLCMVLIPVALAASLIIGIYMWVRSDLIAGVTALTLSLCAVMPVFVSFTLVYSLHRENAKLGSKKSGILNYNGAAALAKTNAVILNAADIFYPESCNIHGIKPFNGIPLDDAIIYTAAMIIKSEGPLSSLFSRIVLERNDILPAVDTLAYEDRLGLSAWIDDRRVFVGTLDFLLHHNVIIPESDFGKYCRDGKKTLFLAIEDKLAAMFVVSYSCDIKTAKEIQKITNSGITLLIHSTDPNINEEFTETALRLEKNTVKVINQKAGEYYKIFRNEINETIVSHNFHNGTTHSFLSLITSSLRITPVKTTVFAVTALMSLLGFIFVTVSTVSQNMPQIGCFQLLIFQLICCAANILASRLAGTFLR